MGKLKKELFQMSRGRPIGVKIIWRCLTCGVEKLVSPSKLCMFFVQHWMNHYTDAIRRLYVQKMVSHSRT